MNKLMRVLCLVGIVAWPGMLAAQEFPNRTIRFIVPFPAGGPSDIISRILIEKMSSVARSSHRDREPRRRRRPDRHRVGREVRAQRLHHRDRAIERSSR